MLQSPEFSTRNILRRMNVEVVCTTDDPVDSLEHHRAVKQEGMDIRMLPAWRPDKAMAVENSHRFNTYLDSLAGASGMEIRTFNDLLDALKKRHDFFHENGCRLSDHGIETIYSEEYTEAEMEAIFLKIRSGSKLSGQEVIKFKSGMLVIFAMMDHDRGWTQQFHIGAIRNNNSRMLVTG